MPLHVPPRMPDVNGRKKTKPDDFSPGFVNVSRIFGLYWTVLDCEMVPKGGLGTFGTKPRSNSLILYGFKNCY